MMNRVASCSVLAALLPHLTWRHHGIGVLQAYVRENVEPEVRVHIWHPKLVREGIVGQGDAHDHRFDLESTVVLGTLYEDIYGPSILRSGDPFWDIWHVENARSAGAERGFDGECRPLDVNVPKHVERRKHPAGTTYTLERGVFHRTRVEALAVTVCTMREKRGQARLLVPAGTEPVHAFGAHAKDSQAAQSLQDEILQEALVALRSVV